MLKHNTRRTILIVVVNMIFYLAFLIMTLIAAIATKESRMIFFAIFGVLALLLGTCREFVRLRYGDAIWYLEEKMDAAEAKRRYEELASKDILKVYEDEKVLWDVDSCQ